MATHPVTPASISNRKPPATAIPAITTDTGSPRSSPVAAKMLTRKNPNDPSARIIAPENVSTATTLSPDGRFMLPPHNLPSTARINKINKISPNPPLG